MINNKYWCFSLLEEMLALVCLRLVLNLKTPLYVTVNRFIYSIYNNRYSEKDIYKSLDSNWLDRFGDDSDSRVHRHSYNRNDEVIEGFWLFLEIETSIFLTSLKQDHNGQICVFGWFSLEFGVCNLTLAS